MLDFLQSSNGTRRRRSGSALKQPSSVRLGSFVDHSVVDGASLLVGWNDNWMEVPRSVGFRRYSLGNSSIQCSEIFVCSSSPSQATEYVGVRRVELISHVLHKENNEIDLAV